MAARRRHPRPMSRCAMRVGNRRGIAADDALSAQICSSRSGMPSIRWRTSVSIAVAQIFGADVDDPAGVDHIIRRVEDPARVQPLRRPRASASWLLAPPATTLVRSAAMRFLVENRAERIGAEHIRLDRRGSRRAKRPCRWPRRRASCAFGLIDVGDRQARAFRRGVERNAGGDAARALQRDVQPIDTVLAERAADRRLEAQEHAERRVRARVAADIAACRPEDRRRYGVWRATSTMSLTLMPTSSAVT